MITELRNHEKFELLSWMPEWSFGEKITMASDNKKNVVRPDAVILLSQIHSGKTLLFFFEFDAGTEAVTGLGTTVFEKIKKYETIFLEKQFQKISEETTEVSAARLIFVTTSEKRIANILRKIEGRIEKTLWDSFLFTTLEEIKKNGWMGGKYKKIGFEGWVKINSEPVSKEENACKKI